MENIEATYDWYLQQNEHLTFTEMGMIQQAIFNNADTSDEDFQDVWHDLVDAAIKYSTVRANWGSFSRQEKMAKDDARTANHNKVIDNFIILERIFKLHNWPSQAWTEKLFLQEDRPKRTRADVTSHRKRIGDFANYLTFINALNNR